MRKCCPWKTEHITKAIYTLNAAFSNAGTLAEWLKA